MNDNVIHLVPDAVGNGFTVDPDQVLAAAIGKYATLVIVGETPDGDIEVCGSHGAGDTMILLGRAQNFIVNNRVVR